MKYAYALLALAAAAVAVPAASPDAAPEAQPDAAPTEEKGYGKYAHYGMSPFTRLKQSTCLTRTRLLSASQGRLWKVCQLRQVRRIQA